MNEEQRLTNDPQVEAALFRLQELVASHYPTATFDRAVGEDPEGTYLLATVDVEDADAVVDVVIDYLLEVQIEQRLPVYFFPLRPTAQVEALLQPAPAKTHLP